MKMSDWLKYNYCQFYSDSTIAPQSTNPTVYNWTCLSIINDLILVVWCAAKLGSPENTTGVFYMLLLLLSKTRKVQMAAKLLIANNFLCSFAKLFCK